MDRIIRLFNPYVPLRPIALLKSHTNPIFFLHLSSDENRIYSMSSDKCLNVLFSFLKLKPYSCLKIPLYSQVWDTIDHSLLASMRPKSHKVTGDLQACCYSQKAKTLLINTDKVSFLSLKLK